MENGWLRLEEAVDETNDRDHVFLMKKKKLKDVINKIQQDGKRKDIMIIILLSVLIILVARIMYLQLL